LVLSAAGFAPGPYHDKDTMTRNPTAKRSSLFILVIPEDNFGVYSYLPFFPRLKSPAPWAKIIRNPPAMARFFMNMMV